MASIDEKNGEEMGGLLDEQGSKLQVPAKLPVLLLRDVVIFPYMIAPLFVGREKSKAAIDVALSTNRMILLLTQKDMEVEDPKREDVFDVGTVALIMRMLKLPDGRVRILAQGLVRARVQTFEEEGAHVVAEVRVLEEPEKAEKSLENEALIRNVRSGLERAASLGKSLPPEVLIIASNVEEPGRLADLTASNLELKVEEAQGILEIGDPVQRLKKVYELLTRELELLDVQSKISTEAKGEMDKLQKQYYLRQQMKAIQKELGEGNETQEEVRIYQEKLRKIRVTDEVREEIEKQITRLGQMHPESAETSVVRNYLDWMFMLPWNKSTTDTLDLAKAKRILEEDHYGLEKVKERILEYLGVRKLSKSAKGPILCFVGPPGVGKTSLGKSIARALGRKFVRISLGGVHDEAEIRGHRRTYVGAMPGRIIQGIRRAGTENPVFMMDEVDKIGADFRGDPSSALLEVLDPEQNNQFRDHYLGVPYDLSKVMFITTANLLDPIQPAFRDRMEVLELPGYTEEEKLQIAVRHLIPKQLAEHALTPKLIKFTGGSVKKIIGLYTREAGVRNLEREMASICRKVARRVAEGRKGPSTVTAQSVERYLGPPKVFKDQLLKKDQIGIATGVAWTAVGGEIMFVEATKMPGKGSLQLTGSLGDVMKESAQAALTYARAHAEEFGIDSKIFSRNDFHVHFPEGAIPKDGPSAGVTIATAFLSVCANVKVKWDVAMTGEITLRGNVLPVGGVKEKVLAAQRAGVRRMIMPAANKKDLYEIPKRLIRDIEFVYVEDVKDVFRAAMAGPLGPAAGPAARRRGPKKRGLKKPGKKRAKG
ncbi:MAG TPA: endopeptidase La [Candidatus Aminicenantes bacterium]|nr:endopeptidase La [Candidatus Aminicenantes bacterium]HRY65921.1 endopeptidase La [Candidatus Aminicenantes bacterium]HRZ72753.1 endopeptidase La [Candidatus Aminicenantes bacterium]